MNTRHSSLLVVIVGLLSASCAKEYPRSDAGHGPAVPLQHSYAFIVDNQVRIATPTVDRVVTQGGTALQWVEKSHRLVVKKHGPHFELISTLKKPAITAHVSLPATIAAGHELQAWAFNDDASLLALLVDGVGERSGVKIVDVEGMRVIKSIPVPTNEMTRNGSRGIAFGPGSAVLFLSLPTGRRLTEVTEMFEVQTWRYDLASGTRELLGTGTCARSLTSADEVVLVHRPVRTDERGVIYGETGQLITIFVGSDSKNLRELQTVALDISPGSRELATLRMEGHGGVRMITFSDYNGKITRPPVVAQNVLLPMSDKWVLME